MHGRTVANGEYAHVPSFRGRREGLYMSRLRPILSHQILPVGGRALCLLICVYLITGCSGFRSMVRTTADYAERRDLDTCLCANATAGGGYGGTVHNTGSGDNQTTGASFMIIADTENWDHSVGLNSPGQSGDPDDPHYRDLFELWGRDRYFPVFYSREKIDSVTESTLVLQP